MESPQKTFPQNYGLFILNCSNLGLGTTEYFHFKYDGIFSVIVADTTCEINGRGTCSASSLVKFD